MTRLAALLLLAATSPLGAQTAPVGLAPLTATTTPLPDLTGIVADMEAARRLGKALFWDSNTGSDGMACASCHYAGGADVRVQNTFAPGLPDGRWSGGDIQFGGDAYSRLSGMTQTANTAMTPWSRDFSPSTTLGKTASGADAVPGYTLKRGDFPTHQIGQINDRNSAVRYTTNDAVSSQGTTPATLNLSPVDGAGTSCTPNLDSPFVQRTRNGAILLRAVEPRNPPSTINAGFQKRLFWDGRANNTFNGYDPFGSRSPSASVLEYSARNNTVVSKRLSLVNASLASQAVGPPLSHVEMACGGQTFPNLARKMLALRALEAQTIHPGDSLLGAVSASKPLYADLIRQAFDPRWWGAPATAKYSRKTSGIVLDNLGFTQMELNFPMFFGIAVMLYEARLVSGQAPLDKQLGSTGPRSLTATEQAGMNLFTGKGRCVNCHAGPTLSKGTEARVEFMLVGDGGKAHYDQAFYNIGVNYTVTDIGGGGTDPWGNPLSYVRQLLTDRRFDTFTVDYCQTEVIPYPVGTKCDPAKQLNTVMANATTQRVAVDGGFHTPTLRNIGLTPPYFHNGSAATLAQVVDQYNRGGNARGPLGNDTTGTGPLGRPLGAGDPIANYRKGSNLDADIGPLGLTNTEKQQLVAFLLALTDNRVGCDMAPFDHPELAIPAADGTGAQFVLPAVGSQGLPGSSLACRPNSGDLFGENDHLARFRR